MRSGTGRIPASRLLLSLTMLGWPMILGLMLRPRGTAIDWSVWACNTALFVAFSIASIAVHELSHAFVATVLQIRVPRIEFGSGPLLSRWQLGGTAFWLHAIPSSALTHSMPRTLTCWALRRWLVVAAGPAAHVVVIVCLFHILRRSAFSWDLAGRVEVVLVMLLANVYLLAVSLLPDEQPFGPSDGLQLLVLPFGRIATDPGCTTLHWWEAGEATADGEIARALAIYEDGLARHPDSLSLQLGHGLTLFGLGRLAEARHALHRVVAREDLPPGNRAVASAVLAWAILADRPGETDLARARELVGPEIHGHPDRAVAHGTRGAVLAASGDLVKARLHLECGLNLSSRCEFRAHLTAWLALTFAGESDGKAFELLDRARGLDPDCVSIPMVAPFIEGRLRDGPSG